MVMKKRQSNAEIQSKIKTLKDRAQALAMKKSINQKEYDEIKAISVKIKELESKLVEEY